MMEEIVINWDVVSGWLSIILGLLFGGSALADSESGKKITFDDLNKVIDNAKTPTKSFGSDEKPPELVVQWITHRKQVCDPIPNEILLDSLHKQWTDCETLCHLRKGEASP